MVDKNLIKNKLQQLEFWTGFKNYVKSINPDFKLLNPIPKQWYSISTDNPDAYLVLEIDSKNKKIICSVHIHNIEIFNLLREKSAEIDKKLGLKTNWKQYKLLSTIETDKEAPNLFNPTKNIEYFEWFYNKTIIWKAITEKYII